VDASRIPRTVQRAAPGRRAAASAASPAAEPIELAPLALRRPSRAGWPIGRSRLCGTRRLRRREILVERARRLRLPAPLAERLDLQDPPPAFRERDADDVPGADVLRGLHGVVVDVDFPAMARVGREAPCLEHASGPEPLVDPDRIEDVHQAIS